MANFASVSAFSANGNIQLGNVQPAFVPFNQAEWPQIFSPFRPELVTDASLAQGFAPIDLTSSSSNLFTYTMLVRCTAKVGGSINYQASLNFQVAVLELYERYQKAPSRPLGNDPDVMCRVINLSEYSAEAADLLHKITLALGPKTHKIEQVRHEEARVHCWQQGKLLCSYEQMLQAHRTRQQATVAQMGRQHQTVPQVQTQQPRHSVFGAMIPVANGNNRAPVAPVVPFSASARLETTQRPATVRRGRNRMHPTSAAPGPSKVKKPSKLAGMTEAERREHRLAQKNRSQKRRRAEIRAAEIRAAKEQSKGSSPAEALGSQAAIEPAMLTTPAVQSEIAAPVREQMPTAPFASHLALRRLRATVPPAVLPSPVVAPEIPTPGLPSSALPDYDVAMGGMDPSSSDPDLRSTGRSASPDFGFPRVEPQEYYVFDPDFEQSPNETIDSAGIVSDDTMSSSNLFEEAPNEASVTVEEADDDSRSMKSLFEETTDVSPDSGYLSSGSTPDAEAEAPPQESETDYDDDESEVDVEDRDAAARAALTQEQQEELTELEREVAYVRERIAFFTRRNVVLLLRRYVPKLKPLEDSLRMKRQAFGLSVQD